NSPCSGVVPCVSLDPRHDRVLTGLATVVMRNRRALAHMARSSNLHYFFDDTHRDEDSAPFRSTSTAPRQGKRPPRSASAPFPVGSSLSDSTRGRYPGALRYDGCDRTRRVDRLRSGLVPPASWG